MRRSIAMALVGALGCTEPPVAPFAERVLPRDGSARLCAEPAFSVLSDDRCRCWNDCDQAGCLAEERTDVPGGVCLRFCDAAAPDCPAGTICVGVVGFEESVCRRTCAQTSDCPLGRVCTFLAETGLERVCSIRCQDDTDCSNGLCNPWSGLCTGHERVGLGTYGRCVRGDQCESGVCDAGFCVTPCSIARNGCPDGEQCVDDARTGDDSGICAPECAVDADCGDEALDCGITSVPGRGTLRVCGIGGGA